MSFLKSSFACLKRSKFHQVNMDDSLSPRKPKEKPDTPYPQRAPSPTRMSTSSSSGSYDIEDAQADSAHDGYKSATQASGVEQEIDVSLRIN